MSSSRILIIGGTGHLGRHVVRASVAAHHPTFALIRPASLDDSSKKKLVDNFQAAGVVILHGSMDDNNSLLDALRKVDIVISAVNIADYSEEQKLISAIKALGTIKRFVLFDFVGDPIDVEPQYGLLKSAFDIKRNIRSALREAGVPFTFIVTYGFAAYYIASLCQLNSMSPPRDRVTVFAKGDVKAFTVAEEDIGVYTIEAADDPRTLNKLVHLRLSANYLSQNDMISLWEAKIGKSLERVFVSEEELVKQIEETDSPSFTSLLNHFVFVKHGAQDSNIGSEGVEVSDLYPNVKYITAGDYLNRFAT